MIDIVTVVFREELPILKLQAESISLYCNRMCLNTIYVVINDDTMTEDDIDVSWWGRYSNRVRIIHRNTWGISYAENGWLTQQLLKLLAAQQSESEWSMVLDSKTIVMQTVELDRLFDDDGKLTWGYMPVLSVFEPAKKIVSDLLQVDVPNVAGPAGIPFFFHTHTVNELIQEVETRTGQAFNEWFQANGMVTEFVLYSGYVQYRDGNLDKMYTNDFDQRYRLCNICHSESNMFNQKFEQMKEENIVTVSIHRGAWNSITQEQKESYKNLLLSRGITGAASL